MTVRMMQEMGEQMIEGFREGFRTLEPLFEGVGEQDEILYHFEGRFESELSKHYPFVGWGQIEGSCVVFARYVITRWFGEGEIDPMACYSAMDGLINTLIGQIVSRFSPLQYRVLRYCTPRISEPYWHSIYMGFVDRNDAGVVASTTLPPIRLIRAEDRAERTTYFFASVAVQGFREVGPSLIVRL
jgi:hypothetical protein